MRKKVFKNLGNNYKNMTNIFLRDLSSLAIMDALCVRRVMNLYLPSGKYLGVFFVFA
jgi:hypothetical protein